MFKPSGYPGRRPKPQPGNPQYQTQQHALPQSLGPPPPLSDLHRWFDYFDHDRSGGLDQEEVISGLIQTHPNLKSQIVREQVYAVWSSFDSDGNGTVDRREFCQQGGLGEALLSATTGAQHHTYTPHQAATHASQTHSTPGPYSPHSQTAPTYVTDTPPPQNPSYVSSPAAGGDHWTCPQCTFVNSSSNGTCKACNGPAPAGAYKTAHAVPSQQSYGFPSNTEQQQFQTVKVNVPPGMKPGQQIRVRTEGTSKLTLVTIPRRDQWRYPPGGQGGAFFEMKVPNSNPPPLPPAPVVVQGYHAHPASAAGAGAGAGTTVSSSVYSSAPQQSHAQQPWQPWETFYGITHEPVPLGMQRVGPNEVSPRDAVTNVPTSGRRKAVIVGINYRGTRAELRGCVNDARNMKQLLTQNGFRNDSTHMVVLVDEGSSSNNSPTKSNILKAMQWLVQGSSPGDILFFHFSGHGAQMPDKTGQEADGFNETILPVDYAKRGQITDDVIWESIVWPLPSGVRLTALMDCCHSGTGLDLPFEYHLRKRQWIEDVNPAHSKGDVIQFSGCEDDQTSADASGSPFSMYQAGGAMTQSFIQAYKENPHATYPQFMDAVHRNLRSRKFPQRPALTTSQAFDVNSRVFSFTEGIEPNHNSEIGKIQRKHIKHGKGGGSQSANLQSLLFEGIELFSSSGGGKAGALAVGKMGKKFLKNFS